MNCQSVLAGMLHLDLIFRAVTVTTLAPAPCEPSIALRF